MRSVIHVPVCPELDAMIKAHLAKRLDRPSRAVMMREYVIRVITECDREERARAAEERRERARLARAETRAKRERSEAARLERERERAARKAERASVPTWNAPIEPEPERAGPDASS